MAPHSSTLAWKIAWMEELGRLQSMGSLRVRHDWGTLLSLFPFMHWRRKRKPLQCSCLENPRDGGAWGAAIYGVAQSWTQLKWLSTAAAAFVRKWAWLAVNSAKECQWPDSCSPREEAEKLSSVIAKMNLMAQKGDQRSPFQKRENWRRIQITVGR